MGYNKKALSKIKADLNSAKAPSKPRDIIVDPRGQWEHPGQPTRIPGNDITMKGVPYPVMAYPNVGRPQMMYPEQEYYFPGADYVDEDPQMKRGGSKKFTRDITATNILFTKNPYLKKRKKRKNRVYSPTAPYFQDGGSKLGPIPINSGRKVLRDWTYGESIGMLQEDDGGYIETELTPEEIQAYRDGGYVVEEVDEFKKGGSKNKKAPLDYKGPEEIYTSPEEAFPMPETSRIESLVKPIDLSKMTPEELKRYNQDEIIRDNKIREETKFNADKIAQPQYFNEGIQWIKDWHNSPMYNQMVLNSFKGDKEKADYLNKLRKENIESIPALNVREDEESETAAGFKPVGWSNNDTGLIEIFPSGYDYGPSIYVHEGLHSSDRPRGLYNYDDPAYQTGKSPDYFYNKGTDLGESWYTDEKGNVVDYPDWMIYNDPRFPKEDVVWYDRVMPPSDQMSITTKRGSNWKDNQAYKIAMEKGLYNPRGEDYWKNIMINDWEMDPNDPTFNQQLNEALNYEKELLQEDLKNAPKKWKQFAHGYVSTPTEVRARLGEIRFNAQKEGIYDPFTEKVTPEIFQNYINKKRENDNWQPMKSLDELRDDFQDEEILWMLNNISKTNDDSDSEIPRAQKGGTYYTVPGSKGVYRKVNGKWQVDWNKSGNFQPITKGDVAKRIAAIEKGKTQYFDKDYGDLVSWKSAKYQAPPKPETSKPTAAQIKAQQNFDKNFKVTDKSKYEKVEDKIQEDIQEYKDYMAAKGEVVPEDTDFADMIKRGWESYGNVKPWWRADPTDQIKASNPAPTGMERMWEYATNPFTAFEYAVSGGGAENMPYNINEMRMAGIDPGVVPGRNLVGNVANMFNLVDAGDKVGRNVEEGNYGTAALEAMRFIPGARMQTGIGNKVASYADDVLQTSKQAGKFKLPKYQNVYRAEHAGFNIPATSDDLTGRWFADNPLETKFYIQNLKDPVTGKVVKGVDAPVRVIKQRLPEYKIKENFGAGMPEDARVMSMGRGNLTNNELDELLGQGAGERFTKGTYTKGDLNAMETAPFLFRNEEGILGADLVNKLRNRTNAGRFSSGRSNLFENKDKAINYLYDEANKFYNPRTSISEYLPFKKGGPIETELTPEEIEWYKSQGYTVEELY